MAKNAPLGLAGLVLLAVSLLFLWFIILSGLTSTTPFDKTYFLRADTGGISGAREVTQWNFFYICGAGNNDCDGARAAPVIGRAWDSNPRNAPSSLVGGRAGDTTSNRQFFLWRFGWVFILITLFFETLAFFTGFIACCGRLGAGISSIMSMFALFCSSVAMSLMTATWVLARNAFHRDGRSASIGRYAFGFAWASWATLLVATILFCLGMRGDKSSSGGYSGRSWRRRRSVRSSHGGGYEGRRVKDDYS
ncbi:related to FMP45 Cell cortex protein involved in sporulation [Fusarium fujikuroi]|uniref:Related to FMP45 Cell cortex protein involved in sporulation n=2 Tax=Fusarium fujikuroi TaxID=5127 RepID=S0E7Y1_GIBF5|nr:related to FMP45 Cell cortex protein involved in sporulation [Fusarium fujikuroi IMI 58289]KLP08376.1 FMP45 Cell cortex protein involved in sporulation [Fusarium fujikuroi]CCT70765.1 related to FMP45 Cell cortex protein involved in sporulation [Fusarium fujikuroi IMI 58289]SCN66944.1 related to FMP45 Cell cortex protein involved in sporulation [Fusarium fujikuroi]SCN84595.1 related to FMP45 Cell cortex protein involved in sporulation [Fusarium fujikuroi]SCN84909.1 related to FMP45 Cell cort